jgi:hypothetical protein
MYNPVNAGPHDEGRELKLEKQIIKKGHNEELFLLFSYIFLKPSNKPK